MFLDKEAMKVTVILCTCNRGESRARGSDFAKIRRRPVSSLRGRGNATKCRWEPKNAHFEENELSRNSPSLPMTAIPLAQISASFHHG
jgi:hypothetical protein